MDTSTVKVHLRNGLFTVDSLASIISQFCKRNRVQKSFSACKKTLKREEKKTSIKKINYKYWLVFARRGCKRKSTGQRICEQKNCKLATLQTRVQSIKKKRTGRRCQGA